jgi:hypothetical protein
MDLLNKRIVEQIREKAQARSAEQIAKGVMSKDTKQAISESTATMNRMREAMQDVVAKTISERTPDNIPSRISEPVLEGAPEKPEMGSREPYELEVDTIGNEALDSSGKTEMSKEEADYETGKKLREEALKNQSIMSKPSDDSADGVQPTRGKELLDFIGEGEGTYDSANRGTINGKIQGAETSAKRDGKLVSEMTVAEIRKYQAITDPKDTNRLFTVGKYQTTPDTFEEAVKALGISEDTVFSSDVQDKVGIYLVSKKRPRLGKYLKGDDSVSTDRAMLALAMEFASVPVPYDIKKGAYGNWPKVDLVAGDSFYKDKVKGGNKALHTVDKTRDILKATFGVLM